MEIRRKPKYENNGSLGTALQWKMREWLQRAGMPSRKGYGFVEHCSNKRPDMISGVPRSSVLKTVPWDGVADLVQKV